jgi:hypothetical protein
MKAFSRWLLTAVAAACTGCLPTITVVNDGTGKCKKAGLSKPLFTVPLEVPVAIWEIDNACDNPVTVEVKDFIFNKLTYQPLECLKALPTGAHQTGWIACTVKEECRENTAYEYSIYLDNVKAADPQIVIRKDPGKNFHKMSKPVKEGQPLKTCS